MMSDNIKKEELVGVIGISLILLVTLQVMYATAFIGVYALVLLIFHNEKKTKDKKDMSYL